MTATVREKKGRPNYFICIRMKDEKSGKFKEKWITTDIPIKGNNKRRVEAERERILAEYKRQQIDLCVDLSNEVMFTDFIKEWLENLKPSIEAVTYDTYRLIVYNQIVPFFEPKQLKVKSITPMHIQQYVNFKLKTVSPNTVRKHLHNLSKCLDSAVKQAIIVFNPVKRIDMPKKVKYMGAKFYNEQQIERLLEVSKGDVLEPIILFALFYGLRRSEILGLKWDAIDFERNEFTVRHTVVRVDKELHKKDSTKNKSSYRVMPITPIIKNSLLDILKRKSEAKRFQPNDYIDEGYVFTHVDEDGRLINPNYVTKRFKQVLERNNLEVIKFHDLRHSSASYLLYLGFTMKEIQEWLGHGDIGTTMNIYAHLDTKVKHNISDKLNDKFVRLMAD